MIQQADPVMVDDLKDICRLYPVNRLRQFIVVNQYQLLSNLGDKTADEIFNQDYKNFSVNGFEFSVGQINSMNSIELDEIREKIEPYIKEQMRPVLRVRPEHLFPTT